MPAHELDGRPEAERAETWRRRLTAGSSDWFVLVSGDRELTGYCMAFTPSCDADAGPEVAEIAALYVAPRAWSCGVGSALVTSTLERMRRESFKRVSVWPLAANERALRLYAWLGFRPDGASFPEQETGLTKVRLAKPLRRLRWPWIFTS